MKADVGMQKKPNSIEIASFPPFFLSRVLFLSFFKLLGRLDNTVSSFLFKAVTFLIP
jgi:hypothetical protein